MIVLLLGSLHGRSHDPQLALGLYGVVLLCACASATGRGSDPSAVTSTPIAPPATLRRASVAPPVAPNDSRSLSGTRPDSGPAAVTSSNIAPPPAARPTARPTRGLPDCGVAPNDVLPDHVVAPNDALSLFADFAHAGAGKIPIYVVNRTSEQVTLPSQDYDPYIKLEIAVFGDWQRAEPHVFSDCGNSYDTWLLEPNSFFKIDHAWLERGRAAKVRFRIYNDLALASNTGDGWYDPEALQRAQHDALASKRGDAALVSEQLFAEHGTTRWEQWSIRYAALHRLTQLPPAQAIPLLERFLAWDRNSPGEYSAAIAVLFEISPQRLAWYVRDAFAAPPSVRRDRLVQELPSMPSLNDSRLVTELINRARNPNSADAPYLLDYLAKLKTPQTKQLLLDLKSDARYPEPLRLRARYDYEKWYGEKLVTVRNNPVGEGNEHHAPITVEVDIENASDKALSFAYREPTDILNVYLTRANGSDQTFLAPKAGVRFYGASHGAPQYQIRLEPAAHHKLRFALMDYFDLPSDRGDGLRVWVNVRLPGVHQVGDSGESGSRLNPLQ